MTFINVCYSEREEEEEECMFM